MSTYIDKLVAFKQARINKPVVEPRLDQRPSKYWNKCKGKCPRCGFIGTIDSKDDTVNFTDSVYYNTKTRNWECVSCYLD